MSKRRKMLDLMESNEKGKRYETISLDKYYLNKEPNINLSNNSKSMEDSKWDPGAVLYELKRLKKDVEELKKGKKTAAKRYRKNMRVCYIPKTPLVEKVLSALREKEDEPFKVTVLKVFVTAAKYLRAAEN